MIIPAVCGLMERADPSTDFILDDGECIRPLVAITEARELMFAELQYRWFEQMSVRKLEDLSVCTLPDARVKNLELYVSNHLVKCMGGEWTKGKMEEWTRKSYEINFAPKPTMAAGCSSGSSSNQAAGVTTRPSPLAAHYVKAVALKRKFALLGGGARVASPMTPTTETPLEVSEFDLYKRTPAAPLDPEMIDDPFVVFKWWSDRIDQFPNMARMAQQFLACPASSAGMWQVVWEF